MKCYPDIANLCWCNVGAASLLPPNIEPAWARRLMFAASIIRNSISQGRWQYATVRESDRLLSHLLLVRLFVRDCSILFWFNQCGCHSNHQVILAPSYIFISLNLRGQNYHNHKARTGTRRKTTHCEINHRFFYCGLKTFDLFRINGQSVGPTMCHSWADVSYCFWYNNKGRPHVMYQTMPPSLTDNDHK